MRIVGIVLLLIGIFALLLPEGVYILHEAWRHDGDAEPSKPYLFLTRCMGAVFCVLGVLVIFGIL